MSTILVTGATGLIGSELTRQLVSQHESVRVLYRSTSSFDLLGETVSSLEPVVGDVTDADAVRAAMDGVSYVYHVAGFVGNGWRKERDLMYRVNVVGTTNVVDAALDAGVQRLVHTSSIAALSRPEESDRMVDENTSWSRSRLNSAYAYSKYLGEIEVHRAVVEGLDAVVVNPAVVFGMGRKNENTRQIIDSIRFQKMPAVPTGSTCVVDVLDVVQGHIKAMNRGKTGERYILGGDNISWKDIFETLTRAFKVTGPKREVSFRLSFAVAAMIEGAALVTGRRPIMTRETARLSAGRYRYNNKKAIEELGCTFRPFKETAYRLSLQLDEKIRGVSTR